MVNNNNYYYVYIYIYIYTGVLIVEIGVMNVEEKWIQAEMLRLEVGSKGLRADVSHKRGRSGSFWMGWYCEELMKND